MKKYAAKGLCFAIITVLTLSLIGCHKAHEKKYYADKNNFITEEAVVDNIIYDEDNECLVIWLSDIDESYQSRCFIIRESNLSIVLKNGVLDKIHIGDTITFTSAPGYFGNGYFMPIVHLTVDGNVILDMNEGYNNLLESYG